MNATRVGRYALALALAGSGAAELGWATPTRPAGPPAVTERFAVRFEALSASSRQQLQVRLTDRGYYDGPIDGHIGPDTREALSYFQRERGLAATGLLDAHTARALGLDVYVAVDEAEPLTQPPATHAH
jgi:peptidoglycan hydrolase-like protein with peptidoglycan-binding domain